MLPSADRTLDIAEGLGEIDGVSCPTWVAALEAAPEDEPDEVASAGLVVSSVEVRSD